MDNDLSDGEPMEGIITPDSSEHTTASRDPNPLPQQRVRNVQRLHSVNAYRLTATKYEHDTLRDWIPRKLSVEEIREYGLATQRRIARIRELEHDQASHPKPIPHIEQALYMARLDFRTRFYRIFRINDLPIEILNNIFHLVAWSAPDPRAAVLARTWLVSTCRHWRTMATQDRTLWNAIWFRNPPDFNQPYLWLERAADSALDIRINDSQERPLPIETTTRLVNTLFKKLSNIRILIIVLHNWDSALFVLQALHEVAEKNIPLSMERFELHRSGPTYMVPGTVLEQEPRRRPLPLFGGANAPSLRYLALNGVDIDWDNSALANLTTLDFRRIPLERIPSLTRFRSLLQNSPDLHKLILDGAGPQWPVSPELHFDLRPIVLPKLKVLMLGDFSMTYGTYLVSQFSAPNVVDLSMIGFLGGDYTPFFSRLVGSTPSVLSLSLNNIRSDILPHQASAIVKWLQSMPQLTFLRLVNVHDHVLDLFLRDSKTMLRATTDRVRHLVCPRLAYLEFHNTPKIDAITNFASARKALGLPLLKIYIGQETHKAIREVTREVMQPMFDVMQTATSVNVHILPTGKRPPVEGDLLTPR